MKRLLALMILCLTVSPAFAYDGIGLQIFVEIGYRRILFARENSAETSKDLRYSGPRLDGQWKPNSFVFIPKADGEVCVRFTPRGSGDIPFYFSDIKVNGVPVDNKSWVFYPPANEGGRIGSVGSDPKGKSSLVIYNTTYCFVKVKKDVRTEVTMQGRSGSVLDGFNNRLAAVTTNLNEGLQMGAVCNDNNMGKAQALAQGLNALIALSKSKLNVSVSPLSMDRLSLQTLSAKVQELAKAYDAEKARTVNDTLPCLYDEPKVRAEISNSIGQACRLSDELQTACLLEFMLD